MLGKILYKTYYQPKGVVEKTIQQGIYNTWQINRGKDEMRKASETLQQVIHEDQPLDNLSEVSFLTGAKFWFMTAFCAYSLSRVSEKNIKFIFYDDGTLNKDIQQKIKSQFPLSEVVDHHQINERLATSLPESKYPFLHYKRRVYPHIKKLTDVHAGTSGFKLLLDSDMIFLKKPVTMMEWLLQPSGPFYIVDRVHSYYYSDQIMERLAGFNIPPKVNVGAIGLKSDLINWDQIEYWAKHMEEQEGSNYLLEQALTAMIVADKHCVVGALKDYIVMPTLEEVNCKQGTLQHYVADSKEWYFRHAWRSLI
ncbi:hypothetical protein OKW21_003624 [Catalinimonas alkaloidigena]|uniref:hypothetical protein n=1 Tax=Catalinimonas alkaloidigena TaxID=1075417 RepID=UPI002406689C|nr:hypothetical protein [Catalinimonas alkaloidigena]MDF9798361.1 hypothetical protein [Catalinimonas alkaloidigena]